MYILRWMAVTQSIDLIYFIHTFTEGKFGRNTPFACMGNRSFSVNFFIFHFNGHEFDDICLAWSRLLFHNLIVNDILLFHSSRACKKKLIILYFYGEVFIHLTNFKRTTVLLLRNILFIIHRHICHAGQHCCSWIVFKRNCMCK